MKTELIIGVIDIILIGLIAGSAWNDYDAPEPISTSNGALTNEQINAQLQAAADAGSATLDMELISQHASIDSCWLLIDGKVYDVTSYLRLHPGGQPIVLPFCGADATSAFGTKAGQGSHSSFATEQLDTFYIGDFNMILTVPADELSANINAPTADPETMPVPAAVNPTPVTLTLNATTVAQHNTVDDCWLIISNAVYEVTAYLSRHPGGRAIIVPYCGMDATNAFGTQAGKGSHSSFAVSELASLKIGTLGGTTTVDSIQQVQQNINSSPAQPTGETDDQNEEDDEEDEKEESDDD